MSDKEASHASKTTIIVAVIGAIGVVVAALITVLGQKIENVPKDQEARKIYQEAKDAQWRKDYSDALKGYATILEMYPGSDIAKVTRQRVDEIENALFSEATGHIEEQRYKEALALYQKIAGFFPLRKTEIEEKKLVIKNGMYTHAARLEKDKDWEKLARLYDEIELYFPKESWQISQLRKALIVQQDEGKASTLIREAKLEKETGNIGKALALYKQIQITYPQSGVAVEVVEERKKIKEALWERAKGFMEKKEWAEALVASDHVTEYFPEDEARVKELKATIKTQRDTLEATSKYKEALALARTKKYSEALVRCYDLVERYRELPIATKAQETIEKLEKTIADTKEVEALKIFQEGVKARSEKQFDLAIETFGRVKELFPDTKAAKETQAAIAQTLQEIGDEKEASALKLLHQGLTAKEKKQYEEAFRTLKKVMDEFPESRAAEQARKKIGEIESVLLAFQDNLQVMCWDGTRWNIYPLDKMTIARKGNYLEITNTTGIHWQACIIHSKVLTNSFRCEVVLDGTNVRTIHIQCSHGQDKCLYISPSDYNIDIHTPQKWTISRSNKQVIFELDGKQKEYKNWGNATPDMDCYLAICLVSNQKIKIYSWKVD